MKKFLLIFALFAVLLAGCAQPADVASKNLSLEADNFRVERRIVLYNSILDKYVMVVEGKCSLGNFDVPGEVSITCKVGPDEYKKHYWDLSDNVLFFAEQVDAIGTDTYHYQVIFRPETVIPGMSLDLSGGE